MGSRWFAVIAITVGATVLSSGASSAVGGPRTHLVNGDTVITVASLRPTSFDSLGPYRVGEVTLSVPVPAEGYSTTVEVWYPSLSTSRHFATYNTSSWFPQALQGDLAAHASLVARATQSSGGVRNARAATGRFPLVVFSHGWAGFRDQSSLMTSHLASWGFVVASPDHPSDDLTEVIGSYLKIPPPTTDPYADIADLQATVASLSDLTSGVLFGHVDARHYVVIGHSAGGVDAEELASSEGASSAASATSDPVVGFIAMAGASTAGLSPPLPAPYDEVPAVPSIFMMAQNDKVVPGFFMKDTYDALIGPRRLVMLTASGHLVFSDTCMTTPGTGSLAMLFRGLHISLPSAFDTGISDGCGTPDLSPARELKVIDQVTVAGVRQMFGFDHSDNALTQFAHAYPGLVALNTTGAT